MQILLIYASTDKYSYEGYTLHRTMFEGEWSKSDLLHTKRDYVESFQAKRISKIGVVHLDVTPDGQVTILDNIQGTNPLKTRKEINPAAAAKRAMRKAVVDPGGPHVEETSPQGNIVGSFNFQMPEMPIEFNEQWSQP